MTKHNKLAVLAALAAVISIAPITEAQAKRDTSSYPASTTPSTDTSTFREWQDENILNNHLRQSAGLPSLADRAAAAEAKTSPAGDNQLKQWQDDAIKNNAMRQRMGLSPQ
jgi:hypothetical protein